MTHQNDLDQQLWAPNHHKHRKQITILLSTAIDIPDAQFVGVINNWQGSGNIKIQEIYINPPSNYTTMIEATAAEGPNIIPGPGLRG